MPRLEPLDPSQAQGKAAELFASIEKKFGGVPNIMRTMGHAPAALQAYLDFGGTLGQGSLSAALREQLALAIAGENSCTYCASAHTAIGGKLGVSSAELASNLKGESDDAKTQAAINFVTTVVKNRGWIEDDAVAKVRSAGYTDGEVVEMIAVIAHNIFTNYFNHIAQTEVDFPRVEVAEPNLA